MSNKIAENFEQLVATDRAQFTTKLNAVVDAFLSEQSIYAPGEANNCFNAILRSGYFSLPPMFLGDLTEACRVHCAAAVLYELSRKAKNDLYEPLGWNALNLDAKRFCLCLLTCGVPSNLSHLAASELLLAKSLAGRLVDDAGLLPKTPREALPRDDPEKTLDVPNDD